MRGEIGPLRDDTEGDRPAGSGAVTLLQRCSDALWGYDYFISYKHADGPGYPTGLAGRLREAGYRVFIDSTGYSAGDELNRGTRRRVRMSSYLLLVARRGAMSRSDWVIKEVRVSIAADKTPIVIDIDGAFDGTVGQSEEERDRVSALRELLRHRLRVAESTSSPADQIFDGPPTEHVVRELQRSFKGHRQDTRRARIFGAAAIAFALLSIAAVYSAVIARKQRLTAERNALISRANQLAAEADFAITDQPEQLETGILKAAQALDLFQSRDINAAGAADVLQKGLALFPTIVSTTRFQAPAFTRSRDHLALSPTGRYLAASDDQNTVQVIDLQTGSKVSHPIRNAVFVRFSGNGSCLLIGTGLNSVERVSVWPTNGSKPIFERAGLGRSPSFDLSPDGRYLALAEGLSPTVSVWDTRDGREIRKLPMLGEIGAVRFSPDGGYLAIAGAPASATPARRQPRLRPGVNHPIRQVVVLWTVSGWLETARVEVPRSSDGWLTFSPNSTYLAVASGWDNVISVIAIRTQGSRTTMECVATLRHSGRGVDTVVFSPRSSFLASGGYDWGTRVWQLPDGAEVLRTKSAAMGYAAAFDSEEKIVAAPEVGRSVVRVWDIETGAEVARLLHGGPLLLGSFLPGSRELLTASEDGSIRRWAMPRISAKVHEYGGQPQAISFSANGRYLASVHTGGRDQPEQLRLWDVASDSEAFSATMNREPYENLGFGTSNERAVAVSDDGRVMVAVGYWGNGRVAEVWDTRTKAIRFKLDAAPGAPAPDHARPDDARRIQGVSLSADGAYLAVLVENSVQLWDVARNQAARTIDAPAAKIVRLSPDGSYLAIFAGEDDQVRLEVLPWKSSESPRSLQIPTEEWDDPRIGFSGDGRWMAVGQDEIRVWSTGDGRLAHVIRNAGPTTSLALDGPGEFLATSDRNGVARVWDLKAQVEAARVRHGGYLASVAFGQNGEVLESANGYRVEQQGVAEPRSNSYRVWYWKKPDLVTDACSRIRSNHGSSSSLTCPWP